MSPVVITRDLGRVYRGGPGRPDVPALAGVTLEIEEGEVRGLLGPNGAGKTTLVKILCTILLPSAGTASIHGRDVVREAKRVRHDIGVVLGGERGLYWSLTGRQNLEYWAALYKVPGRVASIRVSTLLARVGLAERADDRVESYSRGMKQRLHLARGLVGDARVLFFDEPTIGMDPVATRDFRALVQELKAEGRTILLTTHDMAEAEALCDRVALINHGSVLAVETPRALSQLVSQHERIDFESHDQRLVHRIRAMPGIASVQPFPAAPSYRVELFEGAVIPVVLSTLVGAGVTSLRTSRPSLEEVYLDLVGRRPDIVS